MAIKLRCECGAELRLPNEAAGRRARCKHCGQEFTIPTGVITTEVDDALRAEREEMEEERVRRAALGADMRHFGEATDEPDRGFWHDAALSFVLVKDVHNLVTLCGLWFLQVLLAGSLFISLWIVRALIVGFLGLFICGMVLGYLCSFWFRVIQETAEGEDRWPPFLLRDPWEDMVVPLFQFLGTWALVLFPAGAFMIGAGYAGKAGDLWVVGAALMGAGVFMWPTVLLSTALGGLTAAFRIDMQVATVFQAFFPYVAVWLMLLLTVGVLLVGTGAADPWLGTSFGMMGGWGTRFLLATGVEAYCMVVVMRLVGLLFRHFQEQIPWVVDAEDRRKREI